MSNFCLVCEFVSGHTDGIPLTSGALVDRVGHRRRGGVPGRVSRVPDVAAVLAHRRPGGGDQEYAAHAKP